jgi:hypothetical protein
MRAAILLLVWLGGCTTLSQSIPGETDSFAPLTPNGQARMPIFLTWYENCDARGCDTDRDRAEERLVECLNEGLRRSRTHLVTYPGGRIDSTQPSALVDDPRLRGEPDARVTPALSESVARRGLKYVVLLEASTRRDGHARGGVEVAPASPILMGKIGGSNAFTERARFDAAIVDAATQRWVARTRRSHSGNGTESAGLVFTMPFLLAFPVFGRTSPETEQASCTATGEAIGELFRSAT